MFRAVFRKEWRQLRGLRWAIPALMAVVPFAFAGGAELLRLGSEPKSWSWSDVFHEVAPWAYLLVLWPIASAFASVLVFCADRQAGSEAFLLGRPVGRGRIWLAKVSAAAATAFVAGCLCGAGAWWLGRSGTTLGELYGSTATAPLLATTGFFAGLAAASLARSSLVGVVVAVGLLGGLSGAYSWARAFFANAAIDVGGTTIHAAVSIPCVVLLLFVMISWVAWNRSEPEGHGRWKRASILAAGGIVLTTTVFAGTAAWMAAGFQEPLLSANSSIAPSPAGKAIVLLGNGAPSLERRGAVLLDSVDGARLRAFPPMVAGLSWKPDGRELAVITDSGFLGSSRERFRIEWITPDGDTANAPTELGRVFPKETAWAGDRLVVLCLTGDPDATLGETLLVADPRQGGTTAIDLGSGGVVRWLEGPTTEGDVFLGELRGDFRTVVDRALRGERSGWTIRRIDTSRGRLGVEEPVSGHLYPRFFLRGFSPSGRYWLTFVPGAETAVVLDARTGDEVSRFTYDGEPKWLAGDVLFWCRGDENGSTLFRLRPGGEPELVRALRMRWAQPVWASPDHSRLLVRSEGYEVFEPSTNRWYPLPEPPVPFTVSWAGPDSIAWRGEGFIVAANLEDLARRRVLYGTDPFPVHAKEVGGR